MKTLRQISEQIKENINEFIEEAEKNEPVHEKTLEDMKKQVQKAKDLVATAIADEQKLKRAYRDAVNAADRCENRVSMLLQNNEEQHANEIRQQSRKYLELAHDLEQRILAQETVVEQLRAALQEIYHRFNDVSVQMQAIAQEQKQIETGVEFNKVFAEFEMINANAVAKNAEQRAKLAETQAKLWEQRNEQEAIPTQAKKEDFNIDEELANLKKAFLGNRQND